MSAAARRTYIIEPEHDEQGAPVLDEAALWTLLQQLIPTLIAVGGKIEIVADRVKIGELPPEPGKDGPGEPLAQTLGFLVNWRTVPKLEASPLTSRLMDYAVDAIEKEQASVAPQPLERAVEAPEEEADVPLIVADPEAFLHGDEHDEPECDCDGEHAPPCPYATPIAGDGEVST